MQIDENAKKLLESRVERIMGKIDVHDSDKDEIRKELRSHYYDVVMSKAQARGSQVAEKADVDAAFAEAEDPEDTAIEYMKSYIDSFVRAGIVSRTVAYILDLIIALIIILLIVGPILLGLNVFPALVNAFYGGEYDALPAIVGVLNAASGFFTWVAVIVVILTYFIILEGRFGYTPAKRLLRLRVLREDGGKIGYKEAIIRNIPKFISNLIVLDALLMLILYGKEKQRVFDKVAGTIVIHTDRKAAPPEK